MKQSSVAIINGKIFTGERFSSGRAVLIMDGRIEGLTLSGDIPTDAAVVDARGKYVAPGFIDLQVYGGGHILFAETPTTAAIDAIAEALVRSGTTGFLITLATNTPEVIDQALDTLRTYSHPALLGLHLEGPYLNPEKRGAHPAEYIRQPEPKELSDLVSRAGGSLTMMTIAPERFDAASLAPLLDAGVLLSAGHSAATFAEATAGFAAGIGAVTHLFNAMSPFHHRDPGLPGAVFRSEQVRASIIADGIHVDYQTLAISKQLLGDRLFLITDAVAESSRGIYTHVFRGDRYTLPDGTLSGSALTMMDAVANCVRHAGIPLEEALRMAAAYPAALLGDPAIGRIIPGAKANVVIFDDEFRIDTVFLAGRQVT